MKWISISIYFTYVKKMQIKLYLHLYIGQKGLRANGTIGARGDPGDPGEPGDQGQIGLTGDVGDPGETGLIGQKGQQGDKGISNFVGDQGDRGVDATPLGWYIRFSVYYSIQADSQ